MVKVEGEMPTVTRMMLRQPAALSACSPLSKRNSSVKVIMAFKFEIRIRKYAQRPRSVSRYLYSILVEPDRP